MAIRRTWTAAAPNVRPSPVSAIADGTRDDRIGEAAEERCTQRERARDVGGDRDRVRRVRPGQGDEVGRVDRDHRPLDRGRRGTRQREHGRRDTMPTGRRRRSIRARPARDGAAPGSSRPGNSPCRAAPASAARLVAPKNTTNQRRAAMASGERRPSSRRARPRASAKDSGFEPDREVGQGDGGLMEAEPHRIVSPGRDAAPGRASHRCGRRRRRRACRPR